MSIEIGKSLSPVARQLTVIMLLAFFVPVLAQAQPGASSKRALKAYTQAESAYIALNYGEAIRFAGMAIELDGSYIDPYLLLGDIYADIGDAPNAVQSYKKAVAMDPFYYPEAMLLAGKMELENGLYHEAKIDLMTYLHLDSLTETARIRMDELLARCEFGIRAISNPIPFDPENLGNQINTADDEFINAITVDDATLFLTTGIRSVDGAVSSLKDEDFYYSDKINGNWEWKIPIGPPVNSPRNEGALVISPDGRYLLFSACHRPDGYGSCDIYLSFRKGDQWDVPFNLGPVVNTADWETQPCLSSDGRTLYFVSNRPGGCGGSDIWQSSYLPSGKWSEPVNVGDLVNTKADEMTPYIHPDNRTLYFSSKGHPGMGGADLFIARMDPAGRWCTPVNLGFPLNTFADEINLIVDASGTYAYLSSNKLGGYGGMDIYRFILYPEARPVAVNYMKGMVYDAFSGKRLASAFQLIDLSTGKIVVESVSDSISGEFLLAIPTNADYALNVSARDYLFYSGNFSLSGIHSIDEPFFVDVPLQPIHTEQIVILRNIFFDTDEYVLKEESEIELDRLVKFLNDYPSIRIEIRGHTDDQGTKQHNDQLSERRAGAVFNYLIGQGIDAQRLEYNGYGFSIPIASNQSPEGRQMNRRTEFRVIGE
jgi:outer membrane protein OmpA-like peptidoglycan-associated protein